MDQNFEEMKVEKFQSLLMDVCCRVPSLKKACKYQAILGIILSSITVILGAGGNFLLAGLGSASGATGANIGLVSGAELLVQGTLLLIYSILLLSSVRDNNVVRVFRIIKVGCLISLYLELIIGLLLLVGIVIFLADQRSSPIPVGGLVAGFVLCFLWLLLTALVIYAIHKVKPKIVSVYIYIIGILFTIFVIIVIASSVYLHIFSIVIINLGLIILSLDYYLKIFVLQFNMMTIGSFNKNHHQLINT